MKRAVACRSCGETIPPEAKKCPSCGKKRKKPLAARFLSWFLILFITAIFAGILQGISSETKPDARSTSKLGRGMELTREQEEALLDIFTRCGIGEIDSVEPFQTGKDQTSYHIFPPCATSIY